MKLSFKTIISAVVLVFAATIGTTASAGDTYTLDRNDLPEEAREFLTQHFPKAKVGMIKVDKHLLKKTDYDVKLTNGTKIEFNNSGAWTEVDCKTKAVPEALVIKPIRRYVDKNFKGLAIVKIEKKATSFEIELSDGVDLKFDRLGNFKSADFDD